MPAIDLYGRHNREFWRRAFGLAFAEGLSPHHYFGNEQSEDQGEI